MSPYGKLIGVDANFVELRCPQYKGINRPGRVPSIQSLPVWRNSLDIFDGLHTVGEQVK